MKHYLITWQFDVEGDFTPEEAAAEALRVQRNPLSVATVFNVKDVATGATVTIDLNPEEG